MPLVTITNRQSGDFMVPPPVAKRLGPGQAVSMQLNASQLEDVALTALANDGIISVALASSTTVPDNMEAATRSQVIQSVTRTITHADLTAAVNGLAQAVDVGVDLPTGAVVLGRSIVSNVAFSGGSASACVLDVGGTDDDAIVSNLELITDAPTAAELLAAVGILPIGAYSAQQIVATFTPDGAHTLLGLTAGSVTITVFFAVLT